VPEEDRLRDSTLTLTRFPPHFQCLTFFPVNLSLSAPSAVWIFQEGDAARRALRT